MFAEAPYDDVRMDEIAERAGVSRALMYRYFPNKREFFAAIFRRDSDALLSATESNEDSTPAEQIGRGLDAHIDYFVRNTHAALAVNRGPLSGDPLIQGIISTELGEVRRRMLTATGLTGKDHELASIAFHGWLLFARGVCTEWIQNPTISRSELRQLCLRTLAGALGPSIDLETLLGS